AARFDSPKPIAPADAAAALGMAAWYDQRDAVTLLLARGVDVAVRRAHDGNAALHVASYSGFPELVALLLARGAPVNVNDSVYGTPPLIWAIHAWLAENRSNSDDYRSIIRLLLAAGASVPSGRLDDSRLREDSALYAALKQGTAAD